MPADPVEQFRRFYEATREPVFRAVLLTRAGDRYAAEDAVADAYEKAYLEWDKLTDHPNPTGWVIRTAINHKISAWRRQRRESKSLPPAPAAGTEGLDPVLIRLLRQLPTRQREVLALRVLLDFSTEQTAEALGVTQGTVKKQLHRALQELRARLITPEAEEVSQ